MAARRRPVPKRLDRTVALAFARHALTQPPASPHVERRSYSGEVVAEFVLPLRLCPLVNVTARKGFAANKWRISDLKKSVGIYMRGQHQGVSIPLPGRPTVLAVRFSSVQPDEGANGAKIAIDRLTVNRRGLGFLVDDSPKHCRQLHWWEPGPQGAGFTYIALLTNVDGQHEK